MVPLFQSIACGASGRFHLFSMTPGFATRLSHVFIGIQCYLKLSSCYRIHHSKYSSFFLILLRLRLRIIPTSAKMFFTTLPNPAILSPRDSTFSSLRGFELSPFNHSTKTPGPVLTPYTLTLRICQYCQTSHTPASYNRDLLVRGALKFVDPETSQLSQLSD